jgi:carboxyl-terminal processing protease
LTTARYYIPSGRCIQALEYKDGKGVIISDTAQNFYFTRNGRKVNDGGGLGPDHYVVLNNNSAVLKSLINNKIIFEFANSYRLKYDTLVAAEKFSLSEAEYNDFLRFLEKGKYKYPTEAETELESIVSKTNQEGNYELLKTSLDKIAANIQDAKKTDLAKNKQLIKEAIEEEIVSRYYFEKGKIQLRLKRDKDVQEALKLFTDPDKFKKMLEIQK